METSLYFGGRASKLFTVDEFATVASRYGLQLPFDLLDRFWAPPSEPLKLLELMDQLSPIFEDSGEMADDLLYRLRLYVLARIAMEYLHFLQLTLLELGCALSDHTHTWKHLSSRRYWYIRAKTPMFWLRYFATRKLAPQLAQWLEHPGLVSLCESVSACAVLHPEEERFKKLRLLRFVLKQVHIQLGKGKQQISQLFNTCTCAADLEATLQSCLQALGDFLSVDFKEEQAAIFAEGRPEGEGEEAVPRRHSNLPPLSMLKRESMDTVLVSRARKSRAVAQLATDTPADMLCALRRCVSDTYDQLGQLGTVVVACRSPSHWERHWSRYFLGFAAVATVAWHATFHRDRWAAMYAQVCNSTHNFYLEHIKMPVIRAIEVIRYDQYNHDVIDPRIVEESIQSLERMLQDFAQTRHITIDQAVIAGQARSGDLSTVMPIYEQSIRHPVRNMIAGPVLQLLLIQIQKHRVDMERALLNMDALLQSNELNFQFMATMPAVLLFGGFVYQASRWFKHRRVAYYKALHTKLKALLRKVERLLLCYAASHEGQADSSVGMWARPLATTSTPPPARLAPREVGKLLVHLWEMQRLAPFLEPGYATKLSEDISDVASEDLDVHQKLLTINRMYRTYTFLLAHD